MTTGEILSAFAGMGPAPSHAALQAADEQREALVPELLYALERGIARPAAASEREAALFCHAVYLLAKWREVRAFPYIVRWLSLPGEGAFEIAGDIATQDGARILAAVSHGDLEPIVALVLEARANEFCRDVAIDAIGLLAAWGELPRETAVDTFRRLWQELPRPDPVWSGLAMACADVEFTEFFGDVRRAFADGLIDTQVMQPADLDDVEAAPGETLRRTQRHRPPIDDVAAATRWWPQFSRATPNGIAAKAGRNDPCPCGSGRKYKKCCLERDEAAARQARDDAALDDLDDTSDSEFEDDTDDTLDEPLDVGSIVRVCYTRGFATSRAGLRRGVGLTTTEWTAPEIPPEILDSFYAEGIEDLDGHWGDPRAGDPMQVDIIDLETPDRTVTVEIYNRAIALVAGDSGLWRSVHRICETLRGLAGS